MDNKLVIENIIDSIKLQKLAVYCGAGISFNSGLPLVFQLLNYLYEKLELHADECKSLLDSNTPFENIMEKLLIESDLTEFQNIFKEGSPNSNHLFLARLVKTGLLKIIYTTNFDLLIEKAIELEGLLADKDYKVYKTEKELGRIDWLDGKVKIIKIHGCTSAPKEMAITLSQLASNKYLDLRTELLTQIFSSKVCNSVLLLGYSCSDFDLVPIIASAENPSSEIYFVEHSSKNFLIEPVSLKLEKNPFKNYKGQRIIQNTDLFIANLNNALNLQHLEIKNITETSWKNSIDNWYTNNLDKSGSGFKHHIAARLLYAIGDNQNTFRHAEKATKIALINKNIIAYSSELGTMGMALNRLGKYEEAMACYREALPITNRIGNEGNIAAQLQSYATILHHLARNREAIDVFNQALELAIKNENKLIESNILGNITNCYIALKEFVMARFYLNKSITISTLLGNKQAESSQLAMLAQIEAMTGRLDKAKEVMLKAIEIKKMLADNNELCKLLLNLSNIYLLSGLLTEAKNSANEGLEMARAIQNKSLEDAILLNISINQLL